VDGQMPLTNHDSPASLRRVALDPDVERLLSQQAVVGIGVSGGKDSQAVALAVTRHLDAIGHTGPRVLVHADLGMVEWNDSLPTCERLASHLGLELIVVRREAGGMLERWESRWEANVRRYASLERIRLVLPWSTPKMRFCTSELKTVPIASALKKRWKKGPLVAVDGIRAQESRARAKKPVSEHQKRLTRASGEGREWHAILDWKIEDVFAEIAGAGLQLHEAYRVHGSTRVSCAFCIMSSGHDLAAAAAAGEHADLYRRMVELELRSTFAFQGARWLADVAPDLLTAEQRRRVPDAKERARQRKDAESRLPKDLLLDENGRPARPVTADDAAVLAGVRADVCRIVGIEPSFCDAGSILAHFSKLTCKK